MGRTRMPVESVDMPVESAEPPVESAEPRQDALLSIDVGKKNLAMCCLQPGADPHGRDDRILHWVVTSTLPACHALADTLRAAGVLDWLPSIGQVVIERQPGKNTPMVRLQCYLEMFFVMHDKHVALADSRHKLNFAAASPWWPKDTQPESWSYYWRKKLAVQSTRAFLEKVPQSGAIRDTWAKSQKLDDLADSLLQGMAHAHFVAPLENARAEAKRARVPAPRRPSAQQLASGKLAKSHVVSLLLSRGALESVEAMHRACDEFKPLRRAITRHFGSV